VAVVHIYTQTIHRTIQNKQYIEQHDNWRRVGRAPSWLVIPWNLPYNRGKSTKIYVHKTQSKLLNIVKFINRNKTFE